MAFHSQDIPNDERNKKMSLNTFADHAPKNEWLQDFFSNLTTFLSENSLGRLQIAFFRRFLSDAGLTEGRSKNKSASPLANQLRSIGWDSLLTWSVMIANLVANNPQMRWYVDNMPVGKTFTIREVEEMLQASGVTAKDSSSIRKAFKRLVELPLGTKLGWGFYSEEGRGNATLGRRPCRLSQDDRLAVLYALYVFAEKCGGIKQFTLSRLMDETVQSDGVSPAKLFGLDRETMTQFLNGLGEMHGEFLSVTFTHDLEKISLREDKTSADVLALIS